MSAIENLQAMEAAEASPEGVDVDAMITQLVTTAGRAISAIAELEAKVDNGRTANHLTRALQSLKGQVETELLVIRRQRRRLFAPDTATALGEARAALAAVPDPEPVDDGGDADVIE